MFFFKNEKTDEKRRYQEVDRISLHLMTIYRTIWNFDFSGYGQYTALVVFDIKNADKRGKGSIAIALTLWSFIKTLNCFVLNDEQSCVQCFVQCKRV